MHVFDLFLYYNLLLLVLHALHYISVALQKRYLFIRIAILMLDVYFILFCPVDIGFYCCDLLYVDDRHSKAICKN